MLDEMAIVNGNGSATSQRRVTLNNGDTLRPVCFQNDGNRDLLVDVLSFSVIPQ
jgi:hypothetical protein